MDLVIGSLDALVLGTTAVLLLVAVALAAVHLGGRQVVLAVGPRPTAPRGSTAPTTAPISGVTDTPTHPRRPRAPGTV